MEKNMENKWKEGLRRGYTALAGLLGGSYVLVTTCGWAWNPLMTRVTPVGPFKGGIRIG